MRWFRWNAVLLTTMAALAMPAFAGSGTVTAVVVHSDALEGNLLGDSPDRTVSIYLPPDYARDTAARYPVLYLLHGYTATNTMWLEGPYTGNVSVAKTADALIADGKIQPLIIVMPDAKNRYGGSFYVNSPVTGNWEDFIARDLVAYVDAHYRTIARPESRAIAGHSMGAFGALYIATKHPETYRVVYAMTPYAIGMVGTDASMGWSPFAFLATVKSLADDSAPTTNLYIVAMAAAFSPDPNKPPAYVDLPYESLANQPHRVESVWDRWIAHTPLAMVAEHANNLRQFSGIAFDVGTEDMDQDILIDAQAYSRALTQAGIPHRFELYAGTHSDQVAARLSSLVLPYISAHLEGSSDQATP